MLIFDELCITMDDGGGGGGYGDDMMIQYNTIQINS